MELRWHPSSEEHIAQHGVTWDEAAQAAMPPVLTRPASRPGTVKLLGVTFDGRHLTLILAPDDNGRTAYLVTARDMTVPERTAWRRARKG